MRIEYEIYQRLFWDYQFRQRFILDRDGAIREFYPNYEDTGLFSARATIYGLEELSYRVMAELYRTSKKVFPHAHALLLSFFGEKFFQEVLAVQFDFNKSTDNTDGPIEILEPYDGYILGPKILRFAKDWKNSDSWWIQGVMEYDWAFYHARRVTQGWPPVDYYPPLVDGTSLVSAEYDLKALLAETKRLNSASVGNALYQRRIVPGPGDYYAAIYPRNGEIVEAKLDKDSFFEIDRVTKNKRDLTDMNEEFQLALKKIGLVL